MNTCEVQAGVPPAVSLAVATDLASLPAAAQHTLEFFTAQIRKGSKAHAMLDAAAARPRRAVSVEHRRCE